MNSIATEARVLSLPAVTQMSGVMAMLNSNPAGASRIKVTLAPGGKPSFAVSVIALAPKVVHAG